MFYICSALLINLGKRIWSTNKNNTFPRLKLYMLARLDGVAKHFLKKYLKIDPFLVFLVCVKYGAQSYNLYYEHLVNIIQSDIGG